VLIVVVQKNKDNSLARDLYNAKVL